MYDVALLKKLRKQNGLTQRQVADFLHVERSTYAYYESGHTKLNVDTMIRLTRLFKISLAEFLDLPEEPETEPAAKMDRGFASLTREEQKLIICMRAGKPEQRSRLMAAAENVFA